MRQNNGKWAILVMGLFRISAVYSKTMKVNILKVENINGVLTNTLNEYATNMSAFLY